jgi:hypothetical protein
MSSGASVGAAKATKLMRDNISTKSVDILFIKKASLKLGYITKTNPGAIKFQGSIKKPPT